MDCTPYELFGHTKHPRPMAPRIPRQRPHVVQERPDAALHHLTGLDRPLGVVNRLLRLSPAIVLDCGPIVRFHQARVQAFLPVELDKELGVLGRGCSLRDRSARGSVLVENRPQVLDPRDARVRLFNLGRACGAEGTGALEPPVVVERELAMGVRLKGTERNRQKVCSSRGKPGRRKQRTLGR